MLQSPFEASQVERAQRGQQLGQNHACGTPNALGIPHEARGAKPQPALPPLDVARVRRIEQVRKAQEVLVQEQEAARREKELLATVVRPAEAERQAAILRAEGEKQATIIRAEASQKELEYEGAGEAAKIER